MSYKFLYQNAQIKSRESKLLTPQGVQRLLDASDVREASKALAELGFGSDGENFDAVFKRAEEENIALLKEMNEGGALDAFIVESDYINLKILLKAYISGTKAETFAPDGLYSVEVLQNAIDTAEVEILPKRMQEIILKTQEALASGEIGGHKLDIDVDKTQYAHQLELCKKSGKVAKEYFEKRIDYLNISSFERARRLGLDEAFFEQGFIEGGKIALSTFQSVWESHGEELCLHFKETPYFEDIKTLDEGGKLVVFEAKSDDALLKIWKDQKDDLYSIAPVVAFYMSKKTELKIAKLIVAGVKNRVAPQIIKERMRELYA